MIQKDRLYLARSTYLKLNDKFQILTRDFGRILCFEPIVFMFTRLKKEKIEPIFSRKTIWTYY